MYIDGFFVLGFALTMMPVEVPPPLPPQPECDVDEDCPGHDDLCNVVRCIELGADDYIPKPFSPRLVVARVRALLRRAITSPAAPQVLRLADLEIDLDAHTVSRSGQALDLTPTEFSLLAAMAAQPGRAFTRLQLLEAVQGVAYEGYERTIDAHIKNIRRKIELKASEPQYILTVYGVGYKFVEK